MRDHDAERGGCQGDAVTHREAGDEDGHFANSLRNDDEQEQKCEVIPSAQNMLDAEAQIATESTASRERAARIDHGARRGGGEHDVDGVWALDRREVDVVGERREQLAV